MENQPLSLLIFDIDNFKRFNDRYGHPKGDRVLFRFGQVVRECARESDAACRYGGEEFTLVLPGANIAVATEVAERVRKRFAEHGFQPTDRERVHVTVSVGAAELQPEEDGLGLLSRSDAALYQAKAKGKNCTETDN